MEYNIIKLEKSDLPDKLQKIKNPPKELYLIGNTKLLYEDSFAVVGTRKISNYGIENCKFFSKELALRNIPIVSGMALGTDSIAHKEALNCNSYTIAVLGSGFNYIFPKENKKLFDEIIEKNGLVVTEFEPNMPPFKYNFPQRNRIITALSEGVLVIEAACRSGTNITVNNARLQGKKVFALPGMLNSNVGIGVNNLIKGGAFLTTNIEDILVNYPQFIHRKRNIVDNSHKDIKKQYLTIYNCLKSTGKYIEELVLETNKDLKDVLVIISKMELEDIIYQEIDGKYILKREIR